MDTEARLAAYLRARPGLVRLAYRFLGSVSDAEDIVQDAWLRFADAAGVADPDRYLSRIVANLSLDRLRSARARRETYVGPWLPEPIVGQAEPETADAALDISFSVMRALERLSPLERATLFLHDLYDVPYDEIAQTLQRTEAACRQLAARARKRLRADAPRFQAREADIARYVAGFSAAMQAGDVEPLKRVLSEDCEFVSDGGGKAMAALNVIRGRDAVARFILGVARKNLDLATLVVEPATVNGGPGLILREAAGPPQVMGFAIDGAGDIAAVYVVRNPDKLAALSRPA